MSRQSRAKAHAKHAYFCTCGRIVHGNGANAMHFFVGGDRYAGRREGHGEISREAFNLRFPGWWDNDEMRAAAFGERRGAA